MTVVLPYPLNFDSAVSYCKALKPVLSEWKWLHRGSEWRSPVEFWQWHQDNKQELTGEPV